MIDHDTPVAPVPPRYDAGVLREQLTSELAAWDEAGFIPGHRAQHFYRRVRTLARITGIPVATILTDLRAEA